MRVTRQALTSGRASGRRCFFRSTQAMWELAWVSPRKELSYRRGEGRWCLQRDHVSGPGDERLAGLGQGVRQLPTETHGGQPVFLPTYHQGLLVDTVELRADVVFAAGLEIVVGEGWVGVVQFLFCPFHQLPVGLEPEGPIEKILVEVSPAQFLQEG